MVLSGFLEWVLGNTFSSIVFLSFGAFWLTFAGTLTPGFAAFSSFAAEGQAAATGFQTTAFNASWGTSSSLFPSYTKHEFLVAWALLKALSS